MPANWKAPPTTQASIIVADSVNMERWWTQFNDSELNSLVDRAVKSNLDLQSAAERIHAARASVGIATGGLLPTVDGYGSYSRAGGGRTPWASQWTAGLDAAWEIDFFGGIRRSLEQADANLAASVEDRRNVMVTLLGDLATDYIQLRGQQQEIKIAGENLDVQTRNARLARDKVKLGKGTELDVAQADAQVASTSADIATLQESAQQSIYAISVLLALPPTTLDAELTPVAEVPVPPTEIPVGLPSSLLRRRPDIRESERLLEAANAGIGAAVADLFPKFSLSGNVGLAASRIDLLSNWNNSLWSFGPSATWSILDAGRIRSNIDLQNANTSLALIAYRKTVLTALLEVQNVLVAYAQQQQRRVALADAVRLNQRAVQLATRRYQQGQTDFLAVLDAERALFASQDSLVVSNQLVGTNAVALYKALGGGWEFDKVAATTRPVEH